MSRILALEVLNFMSIGQARLEFDESGILNIVGYNDSGKSAITRSLEVLFYDAYSSDQVHFIRDGQDYFGVGLEFDDGVAINKYKYSDGKSVWEMMRGNEVIFTNRLDNGIASLATIPEVISNYLGVVEDEYTDQKLNVRRNTDKLFLINTTGGDNYKIINAILRLDVLAETVKRLNEDRNRLQSELTNVSTTVTTLKNELKNLVVFDEETITLIKTLSTNLRARATQTEYLLSIDKNRIDFEGLVVYDELPQVDTSRISALHQLQELKKATELDIYDELPIVDTLRLQSITQINQLRSDLDTVIPPEIPVLDTSRLRDIRAIGENYNNFFTISNNLDAVDKEFNEVHARLHELSKQQGFKICQNCGTVVA